MAGAPDTPALSGKLVFWLPARDGGRLVFGARGDDSTPVPDVALDADIADDLRAQIGVAVVVHAGIDTILADDLAATVGLAWDANVSRGLRHHAGDTWQDATRTASAAASAWQQSDPAIGAAANHWEDATPRPAAIAASWQDTDRRRRIDATHWQDTSARRSADATGWQDTTRRRNIIGLHWQDAAALRHPLAHRWQDLQRLRGTANLHWQDAAAARRWLQEVAADATPLRGLLAHHWQNARKPPPGYSWHDQPDDGRDLCYDPARLGLLVFERAFTGDGKMVFICCKAGTVTPPGPGASVVIARRRSYVVINSIEVRRADTGQLLPALDSGFSMRLDWRSWTWGFSVSFHASAEPLLQPAAGGDPAELEITVNGQPFRMLVESLRRSVRFPRAVVDVEGRGKAALLDAPYAPEQSFSQPAMINAQQLMLEVLTANGVSMGWTLDWKITDWPIPADTWSHQGTWISAVSDIAAAAGAYVQPHDTAQTLRILPAWPARSWELASATPDLELPAGIATVEEVAWVQKPDYDALYMQGTPGTKNYYRKRAGTPGATPAPMAVHPLLVDAAAANQRAIADLSDTGRQVEETLQLMLLPETGIIKPGTLLRYTDDAAVQRTGIVRSTEVRQAGSRIDQTLTVQAPA
ncbi:MAG: hypothetical protein EPN34_03010 [Burkholderiaceae bacterium]|nr:MAG: hypothetical protein EPN34_03010 [Burkholderiaceae bacterium]